MNNANKGETAIAIARLNCWASYATDDIFKVSGSAFNFLLIRRKLKLYTCNNQFEIIVLILVLNIRFRSDC